MALANSDRELYSHDVTTERRSNYGHTERFDLVCHHVTYGLTCDDYDAMRDRAGDACEICETPDHETTRGQLVIDHFQATGIFFVRGLLCDRCNSVMSRHDRTAPWGPASLPFADKARAYHLNAFGRPTPEEFERAEEVIRGRRHFAPREDVSATPRFRSSTPARGESRRRPFARLDHGPKVIAKKLRSYLTPAQLARLIELLQQDTEPP